MQERERGSKRKLTPQELSERFPYGHKGFIPLLWEEAWLHDAKNHDYASGGSPLGNFERVSTILALYPNLNLNRPCVVALVYMLKQLDAILWGLNQKIEHRVEGYKSRYQDVSVYSKLSFLALEDESTKGQEEKE